LNAWSTDISSTKDNIADCHIWEEESERLHAGDIRIAASLEVLNRYIKDNRENTEIDATSAWRAVYQMVLELQRIDLRLCQYLSGLVQLNEQAKDEQLRSALNRGGDSKASACLGVETMLTRPKDSGLRRRNARSNEDSMNFHTSPNSSNSTGAQDQSLLSYNRLIILAKWVTESSPARWIQQRICIVACPMRQPTLWTLAMIVIALSSFIAGIAVWQDDKYAMFWIQLSQSCLQLLGIYFLMVSRLRDEEFPVCKAWFVASIAAASIALILSPFLILVNGRANVITGHVGLAATVVASVQLIGGIGGDMMELPRSREELG
jgi:hypothetical protein